MSFRRLYNRTASAYLRRDDLTLDCSCKWQDVAGSVRVHRYLNYICVLSLNPALAYVGTERARVERSRRPRRSTALSDAERELPRMTWLDFFFFRLSLSSLQPLRCIRCLLALLLLPLALSCDPPRPLEDIAADLPIARTDIEIAVSKRMGANV